MEFHLSFVHRQTVIDVAGTSPRESFLASDTCKSRPAYTTGYLLSGRALRSSV